MGETEVIRVDTGYFGGRRLTLLCGTERERFYISIGIKKDIVQKKV